ncbi:MAG: hypothetical protein Q7R99_00170 [bacterium]|nr:hypothetical protein [bacterium]
MTTISVPKKFTKGEELVIISRSNYERLLGISKRRKVKVEKSLDEHLEEAMKDVLAGRVIGPFSNLKEGLQALK